MKFYLQSAKINFRDSGFEKVIAFDKEMALFANLESSDRKSVV